MKKLLGLVLLLGMGCNEHKVGLLDNPRVVQSCTEQVECAMEQIDDNDGYDLDDEDVYQQYLLESCVDDWYDELVIAKEFGCGSEYRAMSQCYSENPINECDYDMTEPDDVEDYYNDIEEVNDEKCWTVRNAYSECMP
jgi:hypothetical protein